MTPLPYALTDPPSIIIELVEILKVLINAKGLGNFTLNKIHLLAAIEYYSTVSRYWPSFLLEVPPKT